MVDEAHDDIKEEPVQAVLPRSERPTPLNKTCIKISTKKKQKHPFSDWALFREVCCLPSAQIRDETTRLKSLVQPSDHCLFLLFHMGTNGITTKTLILIKRFQSPEKNANKFRSTDSIFLSPPGSRERLWKKQASPEYEYLAPGLVSPPKHGRAFKAQGMLGPDRIQLSQLGKMCLWVQAGRTN